MRHTWNLILSILLILGLSMTTVNLTVSSQDQVSKEAQSVHLSTDDSRFTHHVEPSMTVLDDGTLFAAWKEAFTPDGGGVGVSYSISTDHGKSWSDPQLVPTDMTGPAFVEDRPSAQSDPWVRSFEGKIYITYIEYQSNASQITLAYTSDLGNTWATVKASNNTGFADKETFTIDTQGNIYLVYDDVGEDYVDVKLTRSFDNGFSFVENVTIADNSDPEYVGPYILNGDPGELFVSWLNYGDGTPQNGDIFFDRSDDYGNTWGRDTDINPAYNGSTFTFNPETSKPMKVSLPVMERDSTGRIYLAWDDVSADPDQPNWDVYFRYSDDNGKSWSEKVQVNPSTALNQWMPELAIDSRDNLHIIYYSQDNDEEYGVQYRVWDRGSQQFSEEVTVSPNPIPITFTRPGEYNTLVINTTDHIHMVTTGYLDDGLEIYYSTIVEASNTNVGFLSFQPVFLLPVLLVRFVYSHSRAK